MDVWRFDEGSLQGQVVEPTGSDCGVCEACFDQERVVDAASNGHLDPFRTDLDTGRGLDEFAREPTGFGCGVLATEGASEQAVEAAGHESEVEIDIDLVRDLGGEGVHVEEVDSFGDVVLDRHAAGVAVDEGPDGSLELVGEEEEALMDEVGDREVVGRFTRWSGMRVGGSNA